MSAALALGRLVRAFFTEHLLQQKQVSPQTVAAYRDTVRLLLTFLQQHRHIPPDQVTLDDLDVPVILAFLDYLETDRHNSSRSRNARLAALRSFFRFVAFRCPDRLEVTTRVLAIPRKKTTRRVVHFLTRAEMEALLTTCNLDTWKGRRDHALLLTLYNTGARVSELVGLRRSQVQFGPSTVVQLVGKGRKERAVPLWKRTGRVLRAWFDELGDATPDVAFPNALGTRLTRHGVAYLLRDVAKRAQTICSSLTTKHVSPHVIRHATAMHLLQAGVDLATIALWLGHERLETTHLYLEADLESKERALKHLAPLGSPARRFKADESLLAFLTSL
ncbi:MAG TPA: tyrosine-type recombinase/integrase [Vicinamibacterales bacterium]|nr:tyrosine-type recombinase/integrase [Vicinamibacterales bacterium]